MRVRTVAAGLLTGLCLVPAARAADVGDFYKDKKIVLVIGSAAGSNYDLYARTTARHMARHLPGNPTVIPQNMVGAEGRTAANWLYNIAPKDGTAIASFNQSTPLDQARKSEGIQFDVARFNWIGNPIVDTNVTMAWHDSGFNTLEDVKARPGLICGGTAATSPANTFPQVINGLLGTKIRIISGYPSATATDLAMERGELNCVGHTWAAVKTTMARFLQARQLNMLVQWGLEPTKEISDYAGRPVPLIADYAKTETDKKVFLLLNAGFAVGKPLIAPPDVPAERIEALRRAFDATMKDPEYLAEAQKSKMDIDPIAGEKVQQIATDVSRSTADVLARVDDLMKPRDIEELKK